MNNNALLLTTFAPSIHPFRGVVEESLRRALGEVFQIGEARESTCLSDMTLEQLKEYKCLICYSAPMAFMNKDRETLSRVIEYIATGGSMLVVHYISPGEVDELAQIAGGRFKMHPSYNTYHIEPVKCDHPILAGIEAFVIRDEMHMVFTEPFHDRTLLLRCVNDEGRKLSESVIPERDMYAKNSGSLVDFGWCQEFCKGRLVYSAPGHGADTFGQEMYLRFLTNCGKWLLRQL